MGELQDRDLERILDTHAVVTLDSRGRICIPRRFLERFRLRSGDKLFLRLSPDGIEIIRPKLAENRADSEA